MRDIIFVPNAADYKIENSHIAYIPKVCNKFELCIAVAKAMNYPYVVNDNWDALLDYYRFPEGCVEEEEIIVIHEDLSNLPQVDFENYIEIVQMTVNEWVDCPDHHYTFVFNTREQDRIEPLLRLSPSTESWDIENYQIKNYQLEDVRLIDFPVTSDREVLFREIAKAFFGNENKEMDWNIFRTLYFRMAEIIGKNIVIRNKNLDCLAEEDLRQYLSIVQDYIYFWEKNKPEFVTQFVYRDQDKFLITRYCFHLY